MAAFDADEMIERFRVRAAAVKNRTLPPVGGPERQQFIAQAQTDKLTLVSVDENMPRYEVPLHPEVANMLDPAPKRIYGSKKNVASQLPNLAHVLDRSVIAVCPKNGETTYASIEHRAKFSKIVTLNPSGRLGLPDVGLNVCQSVIDAVKGRKNPLAAGTAPLAPMAAALDVMSMVLPIEASERETWPKQGAHELASLFLVAMADITPGRCTLGGLQQFAARDDAAIVADLKTMDGGYLEAEMMAKAGATHVVVMERAHEETIKCVVKAGKDFGCQVMGDNMVAADMVAAARRLEDLGCDFIVHHVGYDERRGIAASGRRMPSPLDHLREVVKAVKIPVQAVGGLSLEQAVRTPEYGAPLVVLGAPLTIDADSFKTADGNLEASLRLICDKVHAYGDVPVGKEGIANRELGIVESF